MATLDTSIATALVHHRAGRLADAEAAYRRALEAAPGQPAVLHNLGVVIAAQGHHEAALALFDEAVAREPHYATAHYNRGVALQELGRGHEALSAYETACALDPGHYDCHRALGFLWLAEGNRGRALDHFARTYELRRGEDRSALALRSLTHATRGKLLHDAAQFRHLSARRRDSQRFELLARVYEQVARDVPETATKLTCDQLDMLGEDYNGPLHIRAAPELEGPTLDAGLDARSITSAYLDGPAGAVAIDRLLSEPARNALRRHLLESTIWHDFDHIGGFVASYLEDGLACPLLLQIADELRQALPDLLGPHPLTQAWAFKGLVNSATVEAHADDAAVSLNLWLTPDSANEDPGSGGLLVCRVPPPEDWVIRGYDEDTARIDQFIDAHLAACLRAPFGENRAVLFDSRLFHRSDMPRFKAGYENMRINLTMLFGRYSQHERHNLTPGRART